MGLHIRVGGSQINTDNGAFDVRGLIGVGSGAKQRHWRNQNSEKVEDGRPSERLGRAMVCETCHGENVCRIGLGLKHQIEKRAVESQAATRAVVQHDIKTRPGRTQDPLEGGLREGEGGVERKWMKERKRRSEGVLV